MMDAFKMMDTFEVTVSKIEPATKWAKTITLALPEQLKSEFQWTAGQHIRVKINLDNEPLQRSYSISTMPGEQLRITVKSNTNGRVSNFLNKHLNEGDKLTISRPLGRFILTPSKTKRRSHYFFAAGSGITPIYAMINAMLHNEPDSTAFLLYGNSDAKHTIFREELEQLQSSYADRLKIRHCHSNPSWFSESPWRKGRVNAQAVHEFIKENPPYAQDCQYYLCGPASFNKDIKQALVNIDVSKRTINMESFGGSLTTKSDVGLEATLSVNWQGQVQQLQVAENQTLLQAMLSKGLSVPYSCEGGVCGTCRCKITSGEVEMANNLVLDQQEIDQGDILACQSQAKTSEVSIEY